MKRLTDSIQVAQQYATLQRGNVRAVYVGGGRIRIASMNTPTPVVTHITVPQAREFIAARAA